MKFILILICATSLAQKFSTSDGVEEFDGYVSLVRGGRATAAAVAYDMQWAGFYKRIDVSWKFRLATKGEGTCLALLSTGEFGKTGVPEFTKWDEPNLKGSFAVAFDIRNPPSTDPFNEFGNIYDQPQREVSLHWNSMEIANVLSPYEFRTGKFEEARVAVQFVCGGANVSVSVGGAAIYDSYFVPSMRPFESRPCFGARIAAYDDGIDISAIEMKYSEKSDPPTAPKILRAIDNQLNDAAHPTIQNTVEFPDGSFGRVILSLTLGNPPGGYDPWDRLGAVSLYDDDGTRYLLLRYITPYNNGWTWRFDATDYLMLLKGKKKIELSCGTQGTGWLVTVEFEFYEGRLDLVPFKIQSMWMGDAEIGNPDKPVSNFFTSKKIAVEKGVSAVRLRFVVTGHGMSPNSKNAAEFMSSKRWVKVQGKTFENLLWKTDNYLNPCRPQGGTWKYSRAGWGPGDIVTPWDIMLADISNPEITVEYAVENYVNENRGKTWGPFHAVDSQIISYKKR